MFASRRKRVGDRVPGNANSMRPVTGGARGVTFVAIVAILSYVAVTLLFVMPEGVVKTAGKPITSMASPYFAQKWNLFAPNITRNNPHLHMQVQWDSDTGERILSEWIDVTGVEFQTIHGRPLPSRAHKVSLNLLGRYQTHYNNLNQDQKEIARDPFLPENGSHATGLERSVLTEIFAEAGENTSQIRAFLREDDMVRHYLSYFARAYFKDEDPVLVRWRIVRSYPNTFDERHEPEATRDPKTTTFGWRAIHEDYDPLVGAVFADFVDRYAGSER